MLTYGLSACIVVVLISQRSVLQYSQTGILDWPVIIDFLSGVRQRRQVRSAYSTLANDIPLDLSFGHQVDFVSCSLCVVYLSIIITEVVRWLGHAWHHPRNLGRINNVFHGVTADIIEMSRHA